MAVAARQQVARRLTRPRLFALAILALALAIRLWDLTARSLWMDEAVEYWVATVPLAQLPGVVRDTIQDPPLYSFLLHIWITVSRHEAWLRLLSVFFGMGSVLGVMVIGYRLQGWVSALAGGFLMAILPTAVRYSQEAGQYAPMQCLVIWSLVVLLGLVREPGWRGFVRWGLFAVAAAYTYYGTLITVMVPFACFVVEGAIRRDRRRVRRALWTLAAFCVAILPLLIYYIPHQLRRGPTERAFAAEFVSSFAEGLRLIWTAVHLTFAFQFTGFPCSRAPGWLTVVLCVALLILVARRQRGFMIWFAAAWGVYAVLGWLHLFPFGLRHSIILTPLVVPLFACAVGSRRGLARAAAGVVLGGLCILCAMSLPNRTVFDSLHENTRCGWPETEDLGPVAKYWSEKRSPEQPTYVYYGGAPAFAYYVDRYLGEHMNRPGDWFRDCWRGDDEMWCHDGSIYYGRWLRSMEPEKKLASIFETMGEVPDEFWLIMGHAKGGENIVIARGLTPEYMVIDQVIAEDAVGFLLRRRVP